MLPGTGGPPWLCRSGSWHSSGSPLRPWWAPLTGTAPGKAQAGGKAEARLPEAEPEGARVPGARVPGTALGALEVPAAERAGNSKAGKGPGPLQGAGSFHASGVRARGHFTCRIAPRKRSSGTRNSRKNRSGRMAEQPPPPPPPPPVSSSSSPSGTTASFHTWQPLKGLAVPR